MAHGACRCGRPHLQLAAIEERREDVLSLPGWNGARVNLHALRLDAVLHRIQPLRQYQITPRPGGLIVRVVLRDGAPAEDALLAARRAVAAELDQAGVRIEELAIEAVDEIGRSGTGAKQKLVSAPA